MPGLQNGSICWGNRKSFNVFADVFTDVYHEPVTPIVSNNAYYGYQRVQEAAPPAKIHEESMDTSEAGDLPGRKRQAPEYSSENVKRVRQGTEDTIIKKEEDEEEFSINYLKQTHGCDYYNFKQDYV